jgi:RNA polymerase sigma factor (sigma-70 family)
VDKSLWDTYLQNRTIENRNAIVVENMNLVHLVVKNVLKGNVCFGGYDYNDFVSAGYVGLIDAVEKYDGKGHNTKFSTYAFTRIKGAILDDLRRIDWVPRNIRKEINYVKQQINSLRQIGEDTTSEYEVYKDSGLTMQEYLAATNNSFQSLMILFFSDSHLGVQTYSAISAEGISTAEVQSRMSLDYMYTQMLNDNIDIIIFPGDYFNNSKPSVENIRWAIDWFYKVDALNKPFYIIPGNHDRGAQKTSLAFLKSLKTKNIFLIDDNVQSIMWENISIYFVPFVVSESTENKYSYTKELLLTTLETIDVTKPAIIVSHIHESNSRIGSESSFAVKNSGVVSISGINKDLSNVTIISGHMHQPQTYTCNNGAKVHYVGATMPIDVHDCNTIFCYTLFSANQTIQTYEISGVRKFYSFEYEGVGDDFMSYLEKLLTENKNLLPNDVIFFRVSHDFEIDEITVSKLLLQKNIKLGAFLRKTKVFDGTLLQLPTEDSEVSNLNPQDYFKLTLETYAARESKFSEAIISKALQSGIVYLNSVLNEVVE